MLLLLYPYRSTNRYAIKGYPVAGLHWANSGKVSGNQEVSFYSLDDMAISLHYVTAFSVYISGSYLISMVCNLEQSQEFSTHFNVIMSG